jgi:hypothetical protein
MASLVADSVVAEKGAAAEKEAEAEKMAQVAKKEVGAVARLCRDWLRTHTR